MSCSMSQALTCLVATLIFQYLSPGLTGLLASSMIELWANTGLLKICANSFKLLCTTHDTPRLGLRAEPREHHTSLYTTTAQIQSPSIVNKLYKMLLCFSHPPLFTISIGLKPWTQAFSPFKLCHNGPPSKLTQIFRVTQTGCPSALLAL